MKKLRNILPVEIRKLKLKMMKNSNNKFNPSFNSSNVLFSRFTIPELPTGEQLVLNLKTTWGDRHYVGLNGIEVFSSEGYLIPIKKVSQSTRKNKQTNGFIFCRSQLIHRISIFYQNMVMTLV
jgi:hypothetical protein